MGSSNDRTEEGKQEDLAKEAVVADLEHRAGAPGGFGLKATELGQGPWGTKRERKALGGDQEGRESE